MEATTIIKFAATLTEGFIVLTLELFGLKWLKVKINYLLMV